MTGSPAQEQSLALAPETLERSAQERKRMLIIVNPYATTVSENLRHLVVHALEGRYEVDAVDTEARGHATTLCREAAHEGYDVVVAFGGDGTVNEAANGLMGSSTPLTCLPGGSANVFGKMLGIPGGLVDATEHLLAMADDWQPRKVDIGVVNGRYFTFSSGLGLDASVVQRVDSNPRLKARYGPWFFTWAAIATFTRRYLLHPPRLHVEVEIEDGEHVGSGARGGNGEPAASGVHRESGEQAGIGAHRESGEQAGIGAHRENSEHAGSGERAHVALDGVTAIVQNGSPFTYFRNRPIEVAEQATLDSGTMSGCVLHRARPIDMPFIAWRAFSKRARLARHRHITPFVGARALTVRSADGEPLPLQVDGDYLGEVAEARYSIVPGALSVVA
ncbi:MAG TPA: diacylglycerol kinase family protein [Solirubrobacteraceae bacterium]|jgi:diacylglycerol kinase family enzyme